MGKQKSSTSSSKKTSGAEERGSNSLGEDEVGGGDEDEEQKEEEEEMSLRSEDPLVAARATTAMSRNSSGLENGRRYGIRLFIYFAKPLLSYYFVFRSSITSGNKSHDGNAKTAFYQSLPGSVVDIPVSAEQVQNDPNG